MKAFEPWQYTSGLEKAAYRQQSAQVVKLDGQAKQLSASLQTVTSQSGVSAQAHKFLTAYNPQTGQGTLTQVDWFDLSNRPNLATVASSGNYGDLIGKPVPQGGTTLARPGAPTLYMSYFDTDLHKPITWDGSAWRDATGATV